MHRRRLLALALQRQPARLALPLFETGALLVQLQIATEALEIEQTDDRMLRALLDEEKIAGRTRHRDIECIDVELVDL